MTVSKTGAALAAIYFTTAAVLYYRALFVCKDDAFCGIGVLLVYVPAGFLYTLILSPFIGTPPILQWPHIILTVATNTLFFYLLGAGVGAVSRKVLRLSTRPRGGLH